MAPRRLSVAPQLQPPTTSLPSLRNLDNLTEADIVAAVDSLIALYCPLSSSALALKNSTLLATSTGTDITATPSSRASKSQASSGIMSGVSTGCATPSLQVPAVDSGYASGVEDDDYDKEEEDAALLDASLQQQSSLAMLRADAFEKSFAERWLTTLIARSEELPFFYDEEEDDEDEQMAEDKNGENGDFRRQQLVDMAAVILASFHSALDDEEDDEGVVRNLTFPLSPSAASSSGESEIQVQLNDGALSSTDHTDVGLQSWGASIVFSELACFDPARFGLNTLNHLGTSAPRICELGAGTGLVGLTLAKLLPRIGVRNATIVATDYHAAVLDNLRVNITTNFPGTSPIPASTLTPVQACALDWSTPDFSSPLDAPFDMLVATDVIYEPLHAIWLRDCAARMLTADGVFWLMATVREAGKFQGISDTVRTAFETGGCPTLSSSDGGNGKVLKILEEEALERPRGVGHGQEVGYKLFRIGWA